MDGIFRLGQVNAAARYNTAETEKTAKPPTRQQLKTKDEMQSLVQTGKAPIHYPACIVSAGRFSQRLIFAASASGEIGFAR